MQVLTVKCKLSITLDGLQDLDALCRQYALACTFASTIAQETRTRGAVKLHRLGYREIRKRFGLSANLAVTAIRRVSGNIKANGQKPCVYKPTSVALDARIFTFREKDWTVSVRGLDGRIVLKLDVGDYQRDLLKGRKPKFATLVKTRTGYAVNICVEIEPEVSAIGDDQKVLGVDLGIRNLAYCSNGLRESGEQYIKVRKHYARVRTSLQSKGTYGARRLLKRLKGRESRRIAWMNHNLSKRIVLSARMGGYGIIAMEELRYIRERTRSPSRHLNRMINAWPFGQLQGFVEYKATLHGIAIKKIAPAWTSQTCHKCKGRGERDRENFTCTACGIVMEADANASKNIASAAGGAAVNPPESGPAVSEVSTRIFRHFCSESPRL